MGEVFRDNRERISKKTETRALTHFHLSVVFHVARKTRGTFWNEKRRELPFILSGRVSIPIGVVSVSGGGTDRDVILTDKYRYKNTMYKY